MILLTGATGATGSAVAKLLLKKSVSLRALVRNAEKAQWLKDAGVELVVGDMNDRAVVAKAVAGIDKVLLITVNEQEQFDQEKQFVDCAVAAKVKHVVKLSSIEAVAGSSAPIPYAHWRSEEYIRASGLGWTMIKPSFFMENLYANAGTINAENKFLLPMGDGKVAMGNVADTAAVMAEALTGEGHIGQSYEITGPELLSFSEVADQLSEVLGKRITYVDQSSEDFRTLLSSFGIHPWRVNAVAVLFESMAKGDLACITDTVQRLLGHESTCFRQFVRDNAEIFKPKKR